MHRPFQFINFLAISMFLYASAGIAQDEETAAESEAVPAGQEVEVNEDNYRQFMELKDARQQRNMLPENSYQSQAGAQKIDKLPEESQKHLRNELREIIIQGDQWQPGDENTDYPYVPSNAASTNRALQKMEVDAWGELVDNYHKREAEIYENASRSKAASSTAGATGEGSAQGSGESEGEGEGSAGGNTGQGSEGQNSTAGSYSPNASNDPNATSTEGVSQNAMEFLKGQGNQLANAGEANSASSDSNNGQADTQADGEADGEADGQADGQTDGQAQNGQAQSGQAQSGQAQDGQQTSDEQARTASASAESSPSPSQDEPESDSTAGASQNALEYLMGNTTPTNQEGTLTIEDLMNAQGVGNSTSPGLPPGSANDEENPDKPPPDNSGGA